MVKWKALKRPEWGLASAVPEGVETSWGARAILSAGGGVDIVYASFAAPTRREARRLGASLDAGALGEAVAYVRRLVAAWRIRPDKARQFELYTGADGLVIVGDTNASHGYLYLAAWVDEGAVVEGLADDS